MKTTKVYMCSKGHLHYCDKEPKICDHQNCGSTEFGVIIADDTEGDTEEDDGISD